MRLFKNRDDAAQDLASKLLFLKSENPIVLGLVNGGVPIATVIAEKLDADLDVLILERLYAPGSPDQVVGAVDEHGRISMIQSAARWHHLTSQAMVGPAREAFRTVASKRAAIREILPELEVRGRVVIIVDEGIGSGARMLGAVQSLRDRGASKVIVTAPAGTSKATWQLHDTANSVVIPHAPTKYKGIEHFYGEYTPVNDALMIALIQRWVSSRPAVDHGVSTITLQIENALHVKLACEMDVPPGARKGEGPFPAALFIHGFESDGRSPRNVPISRRLAKRNIFGVRPDMIGHGRSEGDIELATGQQIIDDLVAVIRKLEPMMEIDHHRIGIIASGESCTAAVETAIAAPHHVRALVLRGPVGIDECPRVSEIACPTLIIHAENDTALAETVHWLETEITCKNRVLRVPEANRLFNDPISRELMINTSVEWIVNYLTSNAPSEDRPAAQTAAIDGV